MTPETSYMMYIGMPFLVCGGMGILVTNIQVANLFPSARGMVITFLNGLYGSSAGIFVLFKLIQPYGFPPQTIFTVYTLLSLGCFVRTFSLMPKMMIPYNVTPGKDAEFVISG